MRLQLVHRPVCARSRIHVSAVFALLVAIGPASALAEPERDTQVTSDVLVYSDTDNVVVVSPQVGARHQLDDDGGEVSARYTLDAITAASADVVSSATAEFSELRNEVGLSLSKSFGDWLPSAGYRYSHEPDYRSHGVTAGITRTLAGGDTALGATAGVMFDSIGRVDTPASAFSESMFSQTAEASWTQTLDKHTLARLVYSFTGQLGYLEKPYRSVPLFDADGLAAAGAMGGLDADNYEQFRLGARPLEEVPDSRFRHAIAGRGLRYLPPIESTLKLDYRLYFDSWGVTAHTVEPALRTQLGKYGRLDLWSRFHWQSSASFWRRAYVVASPDEIPALRSTDRSLSESWHVTAGARTAWTLGAWTSYLEGGVMYSQFPEFLFLDDRTALIGQAGVRWRF